jgi:tetratricopeptide (TPR) repeat protein
LAAALPVSSFLSAPATAQQEQGNALKRAIKLYQAGKFSEVIPLAERSLAIYEKARGPDHPDVAATLNTLGAIYEGQGRYADAEALLRRALAICEKTLGP